MCGEDWVQFLMFTGAGALACFYWWWRSFKRYRIMAGTPTSRLRSAAQGFIELAGHCQPLAEVLLNAPLTGTDCVWYRYKIEKRVRSGKNSHWKTVESGVSERFFILRDETGECQINPAGAEIQPRHRQVWRGSSRRPVPPGGKRGFLSGLGSYRYTETRMHPGDPCYALGHFETLRPEALGLDAGELTRDVIREWKQDYAAMLVRFDADGNGELDMNEWEGVRAAAGLEAEARRGAMLAAPDIHVLSEPPDPARPYLLSGKSEAETARRYRIHTVLALIGFFLFGAVATVISSECLLPRLQQESA